MQETKKMTILQKLSVSSLFGALGVLPLVIAPFVSNGVVKMTVFSLGVFLCALFWLFARLADGKVTFLKHPIALLAWTLPVIAVVSALFSPTVTTSLFGRGFETDTALSILSLVLAFFFSFAYFNVKERTMQLYFVLIGGSLLAMVVQVVRMIFMKSIGSATLWGDAVTVLGSWNDFALFLGMIVVLVLSCLEFFVVTKQIKIGLYVFLGLSAAALAAVNFMPAWILVGVLSLFIFIFKISFFDRNKSDEQKKERPIPLVGFTLVIVSLIFILANASVGPVLGRVFNIQSFEVRPSVLTTTQVFTQSVKHNPVLGIGPNHFFSVWNTYKPTSIISTDFWNVTFNAGFGYVPTIFITQGILGGLLWLVFVLWFVIKGFKTIFKEYADLKKNDFFFAFSSFTVSLYCLGAFFIYTPNMIMLVFGFVFMGIFLATLVQSGYMKTGTIELLTDPRVSFFSILILIACMIGVMTLGYRTVKTFWANSLYGSSFQTNSIDTKERKVTQAIVLAPTDAMYRSLAGIYLQKLGTYLNQKSVSVESIQPELQATLDAAQLAGKRAISFDETLPDNWVNLASVYQAIIPLKVTGAYDQSKSAFIQAQKLSPKNPDITLLRAGLEVANQDSSKARTLALEAVSQKQNFVDGYVFLSQLETSLGNTSKAIEYATTGALKSPNDTKAFYWKGISEFNASQYVSSVTSFERSVILNPLFDTSRFMLARAYDKTGKSTQALEQIKILKTRFPENETIKKALKNLEQGQSIDAGINTDNPVPATTEESKSETVSNATPVVKKATTKN